MRKLISLGAVFLFALSLCSTVYANGNEVNQVELLVEAVTEVPAPEEIEEDTSGVLTPPGNMTLVDDIVDSSESEKQFITVTTRSGNYFYIIVDRSGDGENTVHFLNQVDETDLLSLIDGEEAINIEEPTIYCICSDKCAIGSVNANCSVCKYDLNKCTGLENTESNVQEMETGKKGGSGAILGFILLITMIGGGTFYYFKYFKKNQHKGNSNLEDYEFWDDDDEENDELDDLEEEFIDEDISDIGSEDIDS